MLGIRRREFITLLAGVAGWPFTARAQQPAKLPTIGFLGVATRSTMNDFVFAFVQRLRELGWTEGGSVAIEYRFAEGRIDRMPEIAAEFARLKVDMIVTAGSAAVIAAKQAVPTTPIIFALSGDPVGAGLVASLARPGGNVTGLSLQQPDAVGKRLELLREVDPSLRRIGIMANVRFREAALEMGEVQPIANMLSLDVAMLEIRGAEDIAPALESLKGYAQALYVCADPLLFTNRIRINTLAQGMRLPTMYGFREYIEAGGLVSYGPSIPALYRRTADFVDKILRGTKPADIPVEQPTKFELVINLTTAKALGLTIPESFLLRADEIIE